MDMSGLERQRLVLKWQQEQQSCFNELNMLSFLGNNFQGLDMELVQRGLSLNGLMARPIKADPSEEYFENLGIIDSVEQVNGVNFGISTTASCRPAPAAVKTTAAAATTAAVNDHNLSGGGGRESFKKRKAEKCPAAKQREESRSKRSKGCGDEEESKITEQNSNRNSNSNRSNNHKASNGNNSNDKKSREASVCTSKDNSKASEVHKPDYIHVRAQRGQATDSHSLAERVRREKISERMKYLQDLVPGCNKITGKAGMLDEIINYVQSLQRQVEFLSMKLAAVNPGHDFGIDDLIAKQIFATCSTSMPTMEVSPDMANPNYLQYSPIQQMEPVCGTEVPINPIQMGLPRAISAPVPEAFIDPSCFNQIPSTLPWDGDLQNLYPMEFLQGKPSFPSQTFAGNLEAGGLKMEL